MWTQPTSSAFSFKCILINARSICNKIELLKVFVDHYRPHVLVVTESWGRAALLDSLLTPRNYVLFRKDRFDRSGGGVFLLIRKELYPTPFFPPGHSDDMFEDSVWSSIKLPNCKSLLFGCIYRSPTTSCSNDSRLGACFNYVHDLKFDYCLIAGDFNCPGINWDSMSGSLVDCCLDSFLTQIVRLPTRGDHILDLIFVNDTSFVKDLSVEDEFPGADHKTVFCSLGFDSVGGTAAINETCRFSRRFVPSLLRSDLSRAVDWCSKWMLKINTKKSACLHFGRKTPRVLPTKSMVLMTSASLLLLI